LSGFGKPGSATFGKPTMSVVEVKEPLKKKKFLPQNASSSFPPDHVAYRRKLFSENKNKRWVCAYLGIIYS
jgi:hypothetical protein